MSTPPKHQSIHLVLIDALNLIRRIEGGLRSIKQQPLNPEQLVTLTEQALNKLIRGHQPTHIVAVFDGDGDNWRKTLYPHYKENRKPMSTELAEILPTIQRHWSQLGVNSITPAHDEADDIIATLAYKLRQASHLHRCTIISTDQGYLQLLGLNIAIWDHFKQQWQDTGSVERKYQISSNQLLDYWAMVGQSGNKIPGVTGIGPKAALTILQHYGSLKNAFESADDNQPKAMSKLTDNKAQAQLSYQLVRLKQDIVLGQRLSDFNYTSNRRETQ